MPNRVDQTQLENFYLNGYHYGAFSDTSTPSKIDQICQHLDTNPSSEKGYLEQKYKGTVDLRPSPFHFDPYFLDLLFENHIPDIIQNLTNQSLCLSIIQVRKTLFDSHYIGWHRDSYVYGSHRSGNIPSVYKLIIYPSSSIQNQPQLKIIPKSHRRVFNTKLMDLGQAYLSKSQTISASSNHYLFFDTTLLHRVLNEINPSGSYRIIYSFCRKDQLSGYDTDPLRELHSEYEKRL